MAEAVGSSNGAAAARQQCPDYDFDVS